MVCAPANFSDSDFFPRITGIAREAYRADAGAAAKQVVNALDVLRRWREGERPEVDEIHVDGRGTALRRGELTINLGQLGGDLAARLKTFDLVWTALGEDERSRVRRIHLDARCTDLAHVTVAFAST